jgi:hypothetical protein
MKAVAVYNILNTLLADHAWMNWPEAQIEELLKNALAAFPATLPVEGSLIEDLAMTPSPRRAKALLEFLLTQKREKPEMITGAFEVQGYLQGYPMADKARNIYHCHVCRRSGVKLWRASHDSHVQGWCALHAMAQAGYADTIDEQGLNREGEHNEDGTDQVYNPKKGSNLVPWVVDFDGSPWGYTSVPAAGCIWWRNLPTR